MTTQYVYLVIFFCIGYLIVTDESVAKFFVLIIRLGKFEVNKFIWWLRHSPSNPIVRYLIWRRSYKLAKELQDELKSNDK